MITSRIRNQNGFTITEAMVTVVILLLISAIMLLSIMQGSEIWQLINSQSDLRTIARNAMTSMAQELQMATRTSSENPSPNLTIPSAPNNGSIDFYLPFDADGNGFIFDALGNTEWEKDNKIQYQYVPGLKQLRRLEKGDHRVIANNVSSIQFEDNSINPLLYNNELKIVLTLNKQTPQRRTVSVTLTSIVKLRN